MKKPLIAILVLIILAVLGGAIYYNRPQRSVASEKGIEVMAADLVKEYQENEHVANGKYLDKAIQVSGVIADVSKNQDGKPTITLSSNDAMTGVFCTLKESPTNISAGSSITIKGICSGMLSDVRIREAIIVK
jgi:hypothetical protein